MNSLQRPQGDSTQRAPLSSRATATMLTILNSPAVTIAAMAACSAQNPMLQGTSMQTPE